MNGGIVTLSGANSYKGGTTVNSGTLRIAADLALPAAGPVFVAAGAALDTTSNSPSIGTLSGGGSILLAPGSNLTVGGDGGTGVFTGNISGNLANLTKIGAGAQTLSGVNSYTGNTVVNAGRLTLGNSFSLGDFIANSGGVLRIEGGR